MNTLKSLLLGSAAALVVATGAQAASAPGKYDKYTPTIDCPTGFWNTTGTDVCLRVSGFARLVILAGNEDYNQIGNFPGTTTLSADADHTDWYAQGRLRFDARRNTDHGLLRTYVEVQATDNDENTGGALQLRLAFVQLGNWVFGKAVSAFTHGASSPNGADFSPWAHTVRISQVRYTATVGNGLSLSFALENPHYEDTAAGALTGRAAAVANASLHGSGRNDVPTFVAALNYVSGPLDMQLSGVVKQVDINAVTANALAANGESVDEAGFGVAFGAGYELTETVNIGGKAVYTDGASEYNMDWIGNSTVSAHEEIFALLGWVSFEATPDLTFQLHGGWGTIDTKIPVTSAQLNTLPVEGDVYGVGALFSWRPVDGMDIIGEVGYRNRDVGLITSPVVNGDADDFFGGLSIAANLN